MQRDAIKKLVEWKNNTKRKPLILQGARQVGKTWLMIEFGKNYYKNYAYITFDRNKTMQEIFSNKINIVQIIEAIGVESGQKILPDETLIILDEIQECPDAITTLKYFYEQAPEYHIIVAGSLLGVSLSGSGFPVGKVDFMTLYPLSFSEFLNALGRYKLLNILEKMNFNLINSFLDDIKFLLKQYFYIGGMPEIVNDYIENKDYNRVRTLQQNILTSYEQDFSKHTTSVMAERIRGLWLSIPSQLAKENKKFIYGAVREGAKAREYEQAINWLRDCGLIYKINKISKPYLPIRAYEDISAFKLYLLDVGLLGALSNLSAKTIIEEDRIFKEFKGALTEQYVLQQIKTDANRSINYWTSKSNVAEIDFIIQHEDWVIPVEVKSKTNLKSKSLVQYRKQYMPEKSVRTSLANFEINTGLYNIPLYMIADIDKILAIPDKPSQLTLFNI